MVKRIRLLLILLCSLLPALFACGPTLRPPTISPQLLEQEAALQHELLLKTVVDRTARLQRIYTPLRIANADLCTTNISPVTGIIGIDRQSLAPNLRAAAQKLYGVSDGITIIDIVPNSPAAQAGLQPRDVITGAAKGAGVVPTGWGWSALTIVDLVKIIQTSAGNPITLLIRRVGNIVPVVVTPRWGCIYSIEVATNDAFNAFSDGNRIVVYTGLFNHVPDDREIAVIVGHELAHNILRHTEKQEGNAAVGGAAGLLVDIGLAALGINTGGAIYRAGMEAGAKVYSQAFEFEADYLDLYMLARAGFEISPAPDLYRRMGVQHPGSQSQNYFSTHPSTTERAVAVTQTILEIQDKINRQQALLPKNLDGQSLPVNTAIQPSAGPAVATAQALSQLPTAGPPASGGSATSAFVPAVQTTPASNAQNQVAPASTGSSRQRSFAQLYLIKGPIVSNPPQTYSAEFLETGEASVVLSGRRRLTGEFELFGMSDVVTTKYKPRLTNPDSIKPGPGSDTKGFATFSDGTGTELECSYSLTRATGRGQGMCADNQSNTYRIIFD
jgi:beta-barrel assembly-enhancing protease